MAKIMIQAKQGEDVRYTIRFAMQVARAMVNYVTIQHNGWKYEVYPRESYEEIWEAYRRWHETVYGYEPPAEKLNF